jgi:hypothetical protein
MCTSYRRLSILPHQHVTWPVHWAAAAVILPPILLSNSLNCLTLPQGRFLFPLSVFCGLSFSLPFKNKWEIVKSKLWLFNTFFSSHTWAQQGSARGWDHYCSAAGLNGWAVFGSFQLPRPVWAPPVSQQHSFPIWGSHGVLWSMCLVSTPIARRVRLPVASHVAALFFSSAFCVLESSLCHGPCSYTCALSTDKRCIR